MRYINEAGLELVKEFEGGPYLTAYQKTGDVPTIGWGHTRGVYRGMTISVSDAEEFLRDDLTQACQDVEGFAEQYGLTFTDNQFAALVSLTFNCGFGKWPSAGLGGLLKRGLFADAAERILDYNKGPVGTRAGLDRRRKAEHDLFLRPDDAPSAYPIQKVPTWAQAGVKFVIEQGIMVPDETGNFRGSAPVTRQELAVIIKRILIKD